MSIFAVSHISKKICYQNCDLQESIATTTLLLGVLINQPSSHIYHQQIENNPFILGEDDIAVISIHNKLYKFSLEIPF